MAAEQSTTQLIMQAVNMVKGEADNPINNARPVHAVLRAGSPVLKQPTSDCKVANIKNYATLKQK